MGWWVAVLCLFGALPACGRASGDDHDASDAGPSARAGSGGGPTEQPGDTSPNDRDDDPNGQTGSIGSSECFDDIDCAEIACDSTGFLKKEFEWDGFHGNAAYGQSMTRHIFYSVLKSMVPA